MFAILQREFIYLSYYFEIQFHQLFEYWILGILIGSVISVFFKTKIHNLMLRMGQTRLGILGVIPASLIGIASPLCMYGTLPIAATFSRGGMKDSWLAAFMMSSILLNPQLIIYSTALGGTVLAIRLVTCFLCGVGAGLLTAFFYKGDGFFDFSAFGDPENHDTDPNPLLRLLKNIGRNIKATGPWFLLGIFLSACFERYVPMDRFIRLFGSQKGFGILMAATIGVPLYACGGATIPLLQQWIAGGMGLGNAAAFMITGPSTKITNLGALKVIFGTKHFLFYLLYVILFSLACGILINALF
ncbi:MAG: permease [Acidaminococcus sp.]|jgi:uncharacterized membrane protein YraQ (UPF0718 family)|nr:permease [Acidaminococcus sp.]MCI2101057.1 permease [Acidaminococcus sp.]MCI2115471.1 permease [Acidaminococcus sp.]MCI2117593.1 permease [Acidaminococcus sp.]